ncbi:MAG: carboxymuconolactone decarboxylase family protein [Reyranellaceae bacterium]
MSLLPILSDDQMPAASRAVIEDIRATRRTDFVNNFWRVLAHDPALLQRTWENVKQVMGPGRLDPLVKEMIYVAVSVANGCEYCIRSHTAAARQKGLDDAQLAELMAVVAMASTTNRLALGLQVPVDDAFLGKPG